MIECRAWTYREVSRPSGCVDECLMSSMCWSLSHRRHKHGAFHLNEGSNQSVMQTQSICALSKVINYSISTHQCVFACVASEDWVGRRLCHIPHRAEGFFLLVAPSVLVVRQLLCPSSHPSYCCLTTCKNHPKSTFARLRCLLAMKLVEWCQRRVTLTGPKENLLSRRSWVRESSQNH